MSDSTSYGLISRMRADSGIPWDTFHQRYHDLLMLYGREHGLAGPELEELVNDVLLELFAHNKRSLFRYDRARGRFRRYLKTIAGRRAIDLLRRRTPNYRQLTDDLPGRESVNAELERQEAEEERRIVIAEALQEIKLRSHPQHVQVFLAYVIRGRPAAEVAAEYGLTLANLYQIKSRLQKDFRAACAEAEELI